MSAVTILRYDEVGLKGRNRRFFERRLRRNVARALGVGPGAVTWERGRLFVEAPAEGAAVEALGRVFGIRSFSPAERVAPDPQAIGDAALREAAGGVARGGRSFAVESRRSDKSFPLTSLDLNVRLGRAIQDAHEGLRVDLGRPDFRVHVEVRRDAAYVYGRVEPGPGGLPVGSAGRALLLLSGGIDSPVAGWMALKRGLALDTVHFHTYPFTPLGSKDKAVALARELASWRAQPSRAHLVSFTELQRALAAATPERLWTLLLRRAMLRAAQAIALRDGHAALVTGDSLGQVASQTLENLSAADRGLAVPVLRPLITFDKAEIVEHARRIGTFAISVQPFDDCCVLFAPRQPETRARALAVERAERALPVEDLVAEAVARPEVVDLDPRPERQLVAAGEASGTRSNRTRAMRMPSSSSTLNR